MHGAETRERGVRGELKQCPPEGAPGAPCRPLQASADVSCSGWTSLRPGSSDEPLSGDTESETLAEGSHPERRQRKEGGGL